MVCISRDAVQHLGFEGQIRVWLGGSRSGSILERRRNGRCRADVGGGQGAPSAMAWRSQFWTVVEYRPGDIVFEEHLVHESGRAGFEFRKRDLKICSNIKKFVGRDKL